MTRLARGRSTHLTEREIALELLRQFDENVGEVGIRGLAKALGVSPSAIYHHYDSRADIVAAAINLVWEEAVVDFVEHVGDFLASPPDPITFLEQGALSTRRTFARHFRVARYIASAPDSSERLGGALAIFGATMEQLGLRGDAAGEALYAYFNYTIGSVLLASARRQSDEESGRAGRPSTPLGIVEVRPDDAPVSAVETLQSIDHAIDVSLADIEDTEAYAQDEALFLAGLRALLRGLTVE